jgi:hypothetical protein
MRRYSKWILLFLISCLLLAVAGYWLPPIHSRLAWRIDQLKLRLQYIINPPEEAVFVPMATLISTPTALLSLTPLSSQTPTPEPTQMDPGKLTTPTMEMPTSTPFPTVTPLPTQIVLEGIKYEDQHNRWNYCAPSTLSMALSFWGFTGNRDTVAAVLKPDPKDKNVMPYEMEDYVEENAGLKAVLRTAGDLQTIKRFIAAGYPVLVEKGVFLRDISGVVSWMGHYEVFNGYDDTEQVLIGQDAYVGPDQKVPYESIITSWRAFNYVYLVIYPPEKENEVLDLLREDVDEIASLQKAAQRASAEIYTTTGLDQFFAWYNRGSSLTQLQDYAGGAAAFDEAFALYPSIPEKERPWRITWYVTTPYFAYFYTGRYYDVISLADNTLNTIQGEKNIEESYYWRGMAKAALGDINGAIEDYRMALQYHEGFEPAVYQLNQLGVEP